MSTVDLHPVTPANWRACAALSVKADQARFVAPVTYYLCLCTYGDTWQPLAVVRDGMVVGFCMYGIDDDGSAWIGGLLVDQSQQRTGVARAAVSALIDRFVGEPGCPGMALSYAPDNAVHEPSTARWGSSRPAKPRTRAPRWSPGAPSRILDADETSWRTVD